MNASYNLGAPFVTTQHSFWRFALNDLKKELGKAAGARKVAGAARPFGGFSRHCIAVCWWHGAAAAGVSGPGARVGCG